MSRTARRTTVAAAALGALFVLSSCGVTAGDLAKGETATTQPGAATTQPGATTSPTTTSGPDPTEPRRKLTPAEKVSRDLLVKTYRDYGFTNKEARCLADGIVRLDPDAAAGGGTTAIMDVLNGCDIPISRFGQIAQDNGANSPTEAARLGLLSAFKGMGMSEDQADCAADAFIERFGTGGAAGVDPSQLDEVLKECKIDREDLVGGD